MSPAPLRILATIPLYPPGSRVGAWLATHGYLRVMAARGHTVDVITYMGNDAPYVIDGVTVHPSHTRIRPFAVEVDVVVSHLGDKQQGHNEALAAGKPSVRFVHGPTTDAVGKLDGAALCVLNSEASRLAWDGPTIVCPPRTIATEHRSTPGDLVACVNLAEAKGGDVFWEIAAAMPETRFLAVLGGYGPQVFGDLPNVEIIEPTRDMREVWSRTRLLLVPSVRESWCMAAVEAMCSGIPVIAHPSPGIGEALSHAAHWAHRANVGEWVAQIRRLSDPKAWAAASAQARGRFDMLDNDKGLDRFAEAIESLVPVPA